MVFKDEEERYSLDDTKNMPACYPKGRLVTFSQMNLIPDALKKLLKELRRREELIQNLEKDRLKKLTIKKKINL